MSDCLVEALHDLRAHGSTIPIFDADARENWFDDLAKWISALPNDTQQVAWVACIANDLCRRMPGLPLHFAAHPLLHRLRLTEFIPY